MSRLSKILSLIVVIVFLLACNMVTQPLNDARNLAQTAQALGTTLPIETLQAMASAIPAETLRALPSVAPTLEALATAIGDITNPQGTPAQEWKGIPIMPQATVGQEFSNASSYSFKANVTTTEVQSFYDQQLTALGWSKPFPMSVEPEGGILTFQKDNTTLLITITFSDGVSTVILTAA